MYYDKQLLPIEIWPEVVNADLGDLEIELSMVLFSMDFASMLKNKK